jgi:uncharacterized delta-60 repeat protein
MLAILLAALFIPGFFTGIKAQATQEWVAVLEGSYHAISIVTDEDRCVYVVGYTLGSPESGVDIALVKYNSAGLQLWVTYYDGTGHGTDQPEAIALDSQGNIFVAGYTDPDPGSSDGYDFVTIKYSPAGEILWVRTLNGPGNYRDFARDIAVDANGNVYVTGDNYVAPLTHDFTTVGYNADGDLLWQVLYNGPGDVNDYIRALTIDSSGYVYVTGRTQSAMYNTDAITIKYSPAGITEWTCLTSGPSEDALDIEVDVNRNVYITGWISSPPGGWNFLTVKYSAEGVQQWAVTYDGPLHFNDVGQKLALGADSVVYVLGSCYQSYSLEPASRITTLKYNSSGELQWTASTGGTYLYGTNVPAGINVDAAGEVYIGGTVINSSGNWQDFRTLKYSTAGQQLWAIEYNSGGDVYDQMNDLCLDNRGNVYAVGSSFFLGPYPEFTTIKYSQINTPPSPVTLTITPSNPPIQILPSGGSFNFDATLTNITPTPQSVQIWIMVQLPDGHWYGPVLGPMNVTLAANVSLSRLRTQSVPANAPAGNYAYEGCIGVFPGTVWDASSFPFSKSDTTSCESGFGEWVNSGQDFSETEKPNLTHNSALITSLNPNPFNPSTALSFQLQTASHVSLKVYDTAGRPVATLVDGYRVAGIYEVTFDGSNLASGVYLYTLTTGGNTLTGKMVLMK